MYKTYRGSDSAATEEYDHRYFPSKEAALAKIQPGESLAWCHRPDEGWLYLGHQTQGGFREFTGLGRDGHGIWRERLSILGTEFAIPQGRGDRG